MAGTAVGVEVVTGFRMDPTKAAEPSAFLEAAATAIGFGPACLAAGVPVGVGKSHGLLGMGPLTPEGDFLTAALATAMLANGGGFFGTRVLGAGCLPTEELGRAAFFGPVVGTTTLSSTLLSSFMAAEQNTGSECDRANLREMAPDFEAQSMLCSNVLSEDH